MNGLSESLCTICTQEKLKQEIMMIFVESDSSMVLPKLLKQLHDKGYIIAERTVGKYMRELGTCSTVVKKFRPQSKAKRDLPYEKYPQAKTFVFQHQMSLGSLI